MSETLTAVLGLLAAALATVCAAALVEVFRQLAEIRNKLEIDDEALHLAFDVMELPRDLVPSALLTEPEGAMVFLHGGCGTCRIIADTVKDAPPDRTWFVIPAQDAAATASFMELVSRGVVILDQDSRLAERLRMDVAPAVISVQNGVAVSAAGLSTVRQLRKLLPGTSNRGSQDVVAAEA